MLITKPDSARRRIAAIGMFDGAHLGHRFLLDYVRLEARSRRLTPTVVTFSRHPLSVVRPAAAPLMLQSLEERVRTLTAAGADDLILLSFTPDLAKLSAEEFMRLLHKKFGVDALILGYNNRFGHGAQSDFESYRQTGRKVGVEVIRAPEYTGPHAPVSSSLIRRLLDEGHPEKAADMLGHPYRLRGTVVHGQHLGRNIGYPTANVQPFLPTALIPREGVYAAYVTTPDGVRRPAMINIGRRPTVNDDILAPPTIEAHIFDFVGYLYHEEVTIEFVAYIRPEQRFSSVDKLRSAIASDASRIKKLLAKK